MISFRYIGPCSTAGPIGWIFIFLFMTACSEMNYNPSRTGDAPPTRASEMIQRFGYTETFENPYREDDLSKTMSLSELLDIALFNNPSTRASWHAARAAAYAYHVSLSPFYPTVSYFGNWTAQRSNGGFSINTGGGTIATGTSGSTGSTGATGAATTTTTTLFDEFSASYLLLDFGGRNAQAALAWNVLLSANWQHDLVIQEVILSVLTAYTSYLGNKALAEAYEQDLKDAQVTLDSALKMKQYGLATLTDALSAQSTVELTRYNLEQARGAEKTAFGALLIALGLPANANITVLDLPPELPVVKISGDVAALIELAKENRPDIGQAIAAVLEQENQLQISFSSGMPTLTLDATASRLRFLHPKKPSVFDNTISLNWSVPIFQGFYYENQMKQIREQIDEALANLDATVAQITLGVITDYYAFTTAAAALPSSQALLEYSQRAFRGMQSQYKVGTASITDVLTALTTLSNARAQLVMNRTQWAASLANLAFAVGVLEDTAGQWQEKPPAKLYEVKYEDDNNK